MKTIILVKCTGVYVDFDSDELPAVTNEFAFNYGLKQWVNDGAAKQRKDFNTDEEYEAARVAGANERIERLRAGDVPGTRTGESSQKTTVRTLGKLENADPKVAKAAATLIEYFKNLEAQGRAA